ncbi:MAG TPA: glycosyltransferase [Chitinophagaceae bacterium]|nr:glycosyltransferase [Chitinophagaceae bacterium]
MNIAVYSPVSKDINGAGFIVETFFLLAKQHPENRFIIITDQKPTEQFSFHSNIETILVRPLSENAILRKIWWDIKLPAILKKVKADLFLSFHNACSLTAVIPQLLIIQDLERARKAHIKKVKLLVVSCGSMKKKLIEKFEIGEEKIAVIYPPANKMYEPANEQEKEAVKNKYSEDKEFFLSNGIFPEQKNFIDLLKSFSHFKKRQQSSFKLLVIASSNSFFQKSLEGYKYRNDVKVIDIKDKQEEALITASAYAVVLPFNTNEDMIAGLNATRSGVPVIAVKNSKINEAFGDAASYSETKATKDVGEKMMQVYTDENYRTRLIEKGKHVAGNYTSEKTAELLWQSIIKALE